MLFNKTSASRITALLALLFVQSAIAAEGQYGMLPVEVPPPLAQADSFTTALASGRTSLNAIYRYEQVQQPTSGLKTGSSSVVRLRLGYETAPYQGFAVRIEPEIIKAFGATNYNSTANGKTAYTVIVDPSTTQMYQANLSYTVNNTNIKYGRQTIVMDNQRFIGIIPWRPVGQTYDAFVITNKSLPSSIITVGYITNVNRIGSDDAIGANAFQMGNHHMKSPILNLNYKGLSNIELSGYAYLLNYNTGQLCGTCSAVTGLPSNNDPTINSADTYGARLKGIVPFDGYNFRYAVEFATQSDNKNNPNTYKTNYTLLEGLVDFSDSLIRVGYEVLGSDSNTRNKVTGVTTYHQAFSTPLATLHAYNGFADLFLTTPQQGLKDTYIIVRQTWLGTLFGVDLHDFRADNPFGASTSSRLGSEIDVVIEKTISKNWKLGLRYMDYYADNSSTATRLTAGNTFAGNIDTRKLALWGEFKF